MANEMIERVARAIGNAHAPDFPFEQYSFDTQNDLRVRARAAIEAMRDPTDEMTAAGGVKLDEKLELLDPSSWPRIVSVWVWKSMLNEALK